MEVKVTSADLWTSPYSTHQRELYDIIRTKHEDEGLNFKVISDYLNTHNFKAPRNKTFTQSHVWSIYTKKKRSEERFSRKFLPSMGGVRLDMVNLYPINEP